MKPLKSLRGRPFIEPRKPLTDQQIFRASTLWEEHGKSLGEIANDVKCNVYQLGFLYRELLPSLRRVDVTPLVVGQKPTPVKYEKLPKFAVGFRDSEGDVGVAYDLKSDNLMGAFLEKLRDIPSDRTPVIIRLLTSQVVAVWNREHVCWVRV